MHVFHLRVFGGLSVSAVGEHESALTRRRPLALLAVLAVAAPGAVARDKLVALLWPDLDAEHARNVLNQTLFGIRRALGRTDVVVGRSELRLNPDVIDCDVARFTAAIGAGDTAAAVSLYTGSFLDGFFLSDAAEFERWVEDTRRRLARRVVTALSELATASERAGDRRQATEFRWRLAEIDALDAATALALVRALAAMGERARAVQFARRHEALLREEIGSGVDPEMSALVARLLAEAQALPMPLPGDVAPPVLGPSIGPEEFTPAQRPVRAGGGLSRRFRAAAIVLALSTVGALIGIARFAPRSAPASRESGDGSVIAVFPFEVRGAVEARYLRTGLVELLSRGIDGAGDSRSIDARVVLQAFATSPGVGTELERSALAASALDADLRARLRDRDHEVIRISTSVYERAQGIRVVASASPMAYPTIFWPSWTG